MALKKDWRTWSDLLATASAVAVIAVVGWDWATGSGRPVAKTSKPLPIPSAPVSMVGAPTMGSTSAKVGMIEYSDFECPFCRSFAQQTLPSIVRDYVDTGKLLLAFRHLPLPNHSNGKTASLMALCAQDHDKFWPFHDSLFNGPGPLDEAGMTAARKQIGLTETTFAACDREAANKRLEAEVNEAGTLEIAGTPTFLIGSIEAGGRLRVTKRIGGAQPTRTFVEAIEANLRK